MLSVPWLFLAVTLVGAGFTLSAVYPLRRLSILVVPYFFSSWLTAELALHHWVWQAIATVLFIAAGALDAWPGWVGLGVTGLSWWGLYRLWGASGRAASVVEAALTPHWPAARAEPRHGDPGWARPFSPRHRDAVRVRHVAYGDAGDRHHLDIYRPRESASDCPVLVQIHGGAWTIGDKKHQGLPLMNRMAAQGWVCVAPNYRLSPKVRFPEHLIDVKRALAWIQGNIARYGGNPDFVAITGGSAGAHLAALCALTENQPEFQPGFEDVDTSIAACVPFYGIYDFLERHGARERDSMRPFLERVVMGSSAEEAHEQWRRASPLDWIHENAPPFFVIHGTHDCLAYIEDARCFVDELRRVSRNRVAYAEIPGAQHAFDVFLSKRSAHTFDGVREFLERVYADDRAARSEARSAPPAKTGMGS